MSVGKVECVVVGAGVVGLAIARSLSARLGLECIVLEREKNYGDGTSSRNSEVIHAGIYYTPGSLKALHCIRGRKLMINYARERQIPYSLCGKLLVAQSDDEISLLRKLENLAKMNGVQDIAQISEADAKALEPKVRCKAALHCKDTGIIDSRTLMTNLLGDAESSGASLLLNTTVEKVMVNAPGADARFTVTTNEGLLDCNVFINSAGLYACELVRSISPYPAHLVPQSFFCKGNYFRYVKVDSAASSCSKPFSRLVYPMPSRAGLGVHATIDLSGAVRFGPDTEWLEAPVSDRRSTVDVKNDPYRHVVAPPHSALRVNGRSMSEFYSDIRRYYPDLPDGALVEDYAGIRPKLCGPHPTDPSNGRTEKDFVIDDSAKHGIPFMVNLLGIESPGLTSSMSIAEHVADCIARDKNNAV